MDIATHRGFPTFGCCVACFLIIPATAHAQDKKLPSFVQTQIRHAKSSFTKERYNEAIEILDEAIELYPTIGAIYSVRGVFLQRVNRDAEAVKDFSRAILHGFSNSTVYAARAQSKHKLGITDAAISDCTTAINLDDKSSFPFVVRGTVRLELRRYGLALEDLNRAILLEPNDELAYMTRSICRLKMGDEVGAVRDFEMHKALEAAANDARPLVGKQNSAATEALR